MKSATRINTYKFTYKNYLLKYAINYLTITYMPKMLKSSLFLKYKKKFVFVQHKTDKTYQKRKQYQYKKRIILGLLSAPGRYISRKVKGIY